MVHPDLPEGKTCSTPVSLVDILPTFLHNAGVKPEEDYSGESLIDIENNKVEREVVYGQYHREEYGLYMAATENFKYIYSAPDNK